MEDHATGSVPDGLSESVEPAAEAPLPSPPTQEEKEKADNLIRQANLARIRGDKVGFDKLIEEAAKTAPGSSAVQEAIGDAYIERRQVRKAKDAFQLAVKLDPTNASAERKYGEAVLAIQLALDPMFSTPSGDDSLASGKASLLLSFFLPGLGQIVGGETPKGIAMLATWLVGLVFLLAIPQGVESVFSLLGRRGPAFNPLVMLPLMLMASAWMFSIGDAGARAKRYEKKQFARPVPPVDKDFEI